MTLEQWAIKWGVSYHAIQDLKNELGLIQTDPGELAGLSEAAVQSRVRLEASQKGARLFRNNVGALKDARGVPVRFGLANDNAQINEAIKSSDLIGIKPVLITPDMVGRTIGQFLAREVKEANWKYTGSDHEKAQLAFINLIISKGGDAAFCNGVGTI